jgi:glyoxylase-like metal-dependent hydrolase (beta-lactamase superfamily II)
MRQRCLGLFFFVFALSQTHGAVQKIGADLYAYISANDASANATFLVSDQGVLVVDTGLNEQEGQKLLEEIRKISSGPVRWIVNTHYHPDHRGGNSVVGPDAVVISTAFTREQVLRSPEEPTRKKGQEHALNYTLNQITGFTPGDQGALSLVFGGHEVRIYHPGPAHTHGDLVVYFPEQQAIATGDLFLNGSCPAMDDGDMENWVAALDHILDLPVEHVVPGHFALATKTELRHFRDYLADLRGQVSRMSSRGMTLEQVKNGLNLGPYKDLRQFPQYEATFADNATAYYQQLQARASRSRKLKQKQKQKQ